MTLVTGLDAERAMLVFLLALAVAEPEDEAAAEPVAEEGATEETVTPAPLHTSA